MAASASRGVQLLLAFIAGIVVTVLFQEQGVLSGNLTLPTVEEQTSSDEVIVKIQKTTAPVAPQKKAPDFCASNKDCPSSTSICVNTKCTPLANPTCTCSKAKELTCFDANERAKRTTCAIKCQVTQTSAYCK